MRIVVEEQIVPLRRSAVPSVIFTELDHDLVDQWLSEARDLHPGPRLDQATVLLPDERLPPSRGRPHADHGARVRRIRRLESAAGDVRLGHGKRDRVEFEGLGPVYAA